MGSLIPRRRRCNRLDCPCRRFSSFFLSRLLKGEATKQLLEEHLHPLEEYCTPSEAITPWANRKWKVFLDSDEAIENAIRYVEENPEKEGKPRQHWSFVQPYSGLDPGWVTYH
ncbi:MAG: hypothetical protein ACC628_03235 [Pirellulaceae bacterium]